VYCDQGSYTARFEWGIDGIEHLAPMSDVVVVVDVLSFTTAVDVAVTRGAVVFPYRWNDGSAGDFARDLDATLAVHRGQTTANQPYSLSPASLQTIAARSRLVLPSPNGSTLAAVASEAGATVLAGCLRNARAVARAAESLGSVVTVIAAGERWGRGEGTLRPAVEDLLGAGAILGHLATKRPSPEALAVIATFNVLAEDLSGHLRACRSGRELADIGFTEDVEIAARLDVSQTAPLLRDGAFAAWSASPEDDR
jgi:2-phosphosulfolactate phosphatase